MQKLYKQAEALDADSGAGDGARPTLPPLHANAQRRSIVGLPGISATSAGAHVYTARHEGDGGSSTALISEATVKRVSSGGSQSDLSSNLGPADLNALLQSGNNNGPGELMNSGAAGAGGAGASSGAASAAANGTVDGEIEISTIVSKGEGSEMAAAADDNNPDNEITPVRSAATAIATRNPKTKQVAVESTTTTSTVSEHVDNAGGKDGQEDSPSKPLKLAKSKMKRGLTKFHYMKMMMKKAKDGTVSAGRAIRASFSSGGGARKTGGANRSSSSSNDAPGRSSSGFSSRSSSGFRTRPSAGSSNDVQMKSSAEKAAASPPATAAESSGSSPAAGAPNAMDDAIEEEEEP